MFAEQTVLVDHAEYITLREKVTFLDLARLELPLFLGIQRGDINSFGDEDRFGVVGDYFQGTLDAVEDLVQNARTQLNRERLLCSLHGIADSQTSYIEIDVQVS
jgi:hypothetical protein